MCNQLLPGEFIERALRDVQMASALSPQPVSGTLQITNYRLVWFCEQQQQLNVMVPYLDVAALQVSESVRKEATLRCVQLTTSPPDGAGASFQIQLHAFSTPVETLFEAIVAQIANARAAPFYGVQVQEKAEEETQLF